jgi:hypothetical protein
MAGPTDTLSLKGDPRVFFETASFEDIPGYLKAMIFGDPGHSIGVDVYQQKAVVDTEVGRALQVTFDPRVNGALTAAIMFPNGDEADEAAWEFEARFMPDMLTGLTQGFKFFAGASSSTKPDDAYFSSIWKTQVGRAGTLLAGNGGAKSHGNDGWSTRFDMFMSPGPGHPLHGHFAPMQYVYWPEQSSFYGDAHLWNGAGFTPMVGEWHRYTMRLKCNTCVGTNFLKDAEFDAYLDGVLAHRWRGFYLRTTDDPLIMHAPDNVMNGVTYNVKSQLRIGRIWLNTYHGGLALPAARCSFQVRASFDSRTHERLHELPLEEKKADQKRRGGQQRGRGNDRPVDALIGRREHLQPDGQRTRFHRVGYDQRPEEIVPVIADADQGVGNVHRARQRHIDLPQDL